MLNKAVLMGRLTRDPELRYTPNNIAVASFSLAVDRGFKKGDNGESNVDFIDIVSWRHNAEFVSKYFTKGMLVVVSGRIQTRNWEDKQGNKRVSVEVVADETFFAESKKSSGGQAPSGFSVPKGNDYPSAPASFDLPDTSSDFSELEDDDGDVPF